jgi:bisphosphoglycerate-independent phosphoglycerate mutase (AlkP superfamily)
MRIRKVLLVLTLLFILSDAGYAVSETALSNVERPRGAVLFIVDGLGSSYYYPEFTPYALDGSELTKAISENLTFGTRILDIKTPYPSTGIAHSVIVTGYSGANQEMVSYPDATIYDTTRHYGFINLAVMQKGDFPNMREEQDIILFAENNSIDEPLISLQAKASPSGMYELMYEWKMKLPGYLVNKSGIHKYSAYNRWGIAAATAAAEYMVRNHPSRKFFLTVNIGAIDSGGHYLGDDDYTGLIQDLDRDIYPLYKLALDNNIAFFLTADHGMSFSRKNARRGGHASEKYSSRLESLRIPFVIRSPNIVPGTVVGAMSS